MAFLGQEEQVRELHDRFRYLNAAVFVGLGIILSRLIFLQILNGDKMRHYSEKNRIKRVSIKAPRGMVLDRNGTILVDNLPAFDLEITPQYLRSSKRKKEVIHQLSELIEIPEKKIYSILRKSRHQPAFLPVKIKTDLSRDEVAKIETWKIHMPGVSVTEEIRRTNLQGNTGAHLVGYIGQVNRRELPKLRKKGLDYKLNDTIGKAGLERKFESKLRGTEGQELIEVDALGRRIARNRKHGQVIKKDAYTPAVPGKNLVLTIDNDLQHEAVEAFGDTIGSLVALDPNSGEILAMMSRPSYSTTEFSRGISTKLWKELTGNEFHPLRDKTIQDHYSPGSVFKVVTAIAALEEGAINKNTKFHCGGAIRVGRRTYHCNGVHGEVDVVKALTRSCNVFFYRAAQKLKNVNAIAKWAFNLGLGKKTGIALDREIPGLIPTEEWKLRRFGKPWTHGETLSVAIGQSFVLTTVLQLANMYSAIANGGTLYRPYVVKAIQTSDGKNQEVFEKQVLEQVDVSEKALSIVKEGLWGVVNHPKGTARSKKIPGFDFAGKTGTAQFIRLSAEKLFMKCKEMRYKYRHHGVFVGFAPVDDPKIVVAVLGEHACSGSAGAAPIVRAVVKKYLEKYYPDRFGPEAIAEKLKKAPKPRYPIPRPKPTTAAVTGAPSEEEGG